MSYRLVKQFKKQLEILKVKYKVGAKMYVAVDVHETILKPTHSTDMSQDFYDHAIESLQLMSQHPDIVLILWTSSLEELSHQYLEYFEDHGIKFKFLNGNPEIPSPEYADFSKKFFVNVIIDDKAGFNANTDWEPLFDFFQLLKYKGFYYNYTSVIAGQPVDFELSILNHEKQFYGQLNKPSE